MNGSCLRYRLLAVLGFGIVGLASAQVDPMPACTRAMNTATANPSLVNQIFDIANNNTCLVEQAVRILPNTDIQPVLQPLTTAFQNYQTSQQNSSGSSTASTSTVSKPVGGTAPIEDFGGVSITPGTSSTTFQFSPGQLLENLQTSGAKLPCDRYFPVSTQQHCISADETDFWLHWTFAATAQTLISDTYSCLLATIISPCWK